MIPYLFRNTTRSLKMPAFSGGINKRDGLTLINDNQLTDVLNMWFKDGMLKTRPSLSAPCTSSNLLDVQGAKVLDVKVFKNILVTLPSMHLAESLCTFLVIKYEKDGAYCLKSWFISLDDQHIENYIAEYTEDVSYFAYAFNNKVYLFVSGETVKDIYEVTSGDARLLGEQDVYAPLVLTNGKPLGNDANATSGGDQVYGYNLLTRYYKAEYSTVDPNDDSLGMIFTLPVMFGDDNGAGCTVKAEWTRDDGKTYTYEVVLDENGMGKMETVDEATGLKIRVDNGSVEFLDEEGYTASDSTFIKNNLVITAPGPYDESQKKMVFDMTVSAWYGGSAVGIFGGSRLFLGGNKNTEEQALLVWTDLNQPLYFSENNNTYIGDKGQGIVALGNQESSLVVLKEREIHYTYQAMNGSVTSEDIQNPSALDLSTLFAYFPIVQIASGIGCDSADSVQMCRNRLVWSFEGKVYTLTNQSQYSERNVFSVSEMVGKLDSANCLSADCFDHYLLFSGNKAYVMDYNSYGYAYVASYQKNEDANSKIPWFIWEFPIEPKAIIKFTADEGLMMVNSSNKDGRAVVDIWALHTSNDESGYDLIRELVPGEEYYGEIIETPIHSSLQTKLFDFGLPSNYKNVNLVNVTFGNNHGEIINVSFISEASTTDEHTLRLMESEENERSPKYFHSKRFFPFTKSTVNFGMKIECDGNLSVGAVTLEYKALGGAR
jgi:hypothetical protein